MIWKSQKSKRKEFETITRKVVEKHTQKCRDRQIRSMLNKKNILQQKATKRTKSRQINGGDGLRREGDWEESKE